MTFKSFLPMAALCLLASCSNSSKQEKAEGSSADSVQTSVMSFQDCDLTLGGIHFTKMLNEADKQVSEKAGVITFVAPEKTDLFIDPNDAKLTANTAKVLFTEVDNTKPFTFSAKMKPGFTPDGLYHAADLIVMANDTLYQKFCFEQDERGKHRVVTVRTVGTSDDNNHEVVNQDFIYYKIKKGLLRRQRWQSLIKDNQKNFSRLQMLIDAIVIAVISHPVGNSGIWFMIGNP